MKFAKHIFVLSMTAIALSLTNCTKDVEIPFPDTEPIVIVDGQIETGAPPILFLTKSQSFNAPVDPSALADIFENDAMVQVSNGMDTVPLQEFCSSELTPAELELFSDIFGVSEQDLIELNYCLYLDPTFSMVGEEGKEYELMIETQDGQAINAVTRIDPPIPLDSLWFELWATEDTLGFLHGLLDDPAIDRNAYHWEAQRINSYPGTGVMKDFDFVAPLGAVFEDRFFDGLEIEIFYNRGVVFNSNKEDDNNEEAGFFKVGDTVAVKLSSISLETYNYIFESDNQLSTNGSPFAVPNNLPSNVTGGLGLWAGYGPVIDTVICNP